MNLAKVYLLARGIPLMDFPRHGIAEASSNPYTPIYLAQALDLFDELDDKNRQQLGPLFIKTVNSNLPTGQWRIARLFESLPHVHRTLVAESGGKHLFCPVGFRVEMDAGQFRARAYVDEGDQDVQDTIDAILGRADIRALLMDSGASLNPNTGAISREFITAPEADDGTDEPIRAIANRLRELQVFHLLTRGGYRYYLHVRPPSDNLNQLAVSYMLMYYLGSLTRYHPQHYREIFSDRQWLVRDFLETDPIQFTYGLASEIAGVDVVVPQSVRMNDIQIT